MSDALEQSFSVRLRFATLRTKDLARSVAFYEQVLGLHRTKTSEGAFVQLDAGGAELRVDIAQSEDEPFLIFAGDDLPALCQRLQEANIPLEDGGPSDTYAVVRDPDGRLMVFEV